MGTRMDRAGRQRMIKIVLRMAWRKDAALRLTVGDVAKRMGLKSSTYLKNMLRDMSRFDDEICSVEKNGCTRWYFRPYVQQAFDQREIMIHGERRKVADWVKDLVGGVM